MPDYRSTCEDCRRLTSGTCWRHSTMSTTLIVPADDPRDALARRLHEAGVGCRYIRVPPAYLGGYYDEKKACEPRGHTKDVAIITAILADLSPAQAAEQDAPEPLTALRHIRDLCDLSVEDMRAQHGSEQRVLMAVIPAIVDAALAAAPPPAPTSEQDRLADGEALARLEALPAPEGFRRWVSISIDPDKLVGRYDVRTGVTHIREGWPDDKHIGHGNTLDAAVRAALDEPVTGEPER